MSSVPWKRVLLCAAAGLVAIVVLVLWRGFFLQHAVLIGIAVMALVYSVLRTAERLRDLHRPQ